MNFYSYLFLVMFSPRGVNYRTFLDRYIADGHILLGCFFGYAPKIFAFQLLKSSRYAGAVRIYVALKYVYLDVGDQVYYFHLNVCLMVNM